MVLKQFLKHWLKAEFPNPTREQLKACIPEKLRKAFPDRDLQSILDRVEREIQKASEMSLQRCFWSEYKQRPTVKHAVACSGNVCVTFASDGYAGSSPDVTVAIASGFQKTLYMADKGFLLHAEFAKVLHELLTPPKKLRHQDTFTIDAI